MQIIERIFAILKYGKDSFTVEKLIECKNQMELNTQEQYWISHLNTLAPNGYNLSNGGTNRHATGITKLRLSQMTKQYFENKEHRQEQSKRIEHSYSERRLEFFRDKQVNRISIRDIKTKTSPPHIRVYVHYTIEGNGKEQQKRTNFQYNGLSRDSALKRARDFATELTTNIKED